MKPAGGNFILQPRCEPKYFIKITSLCFFLDLSWCIMCQKYVMYNSHKNHRDEISVNYLINIITAVIH